MSSSERLVVLGGVGLAAASVVPWYKADGFTFGATRTNGWQEPDAILSQAGTVLGIGLALLVLVVSRQADRPSPGGMSWGTSLTALALAVFALVALKYSLNTDNTTVGVYLALTAAVVQLYGAYVTRVEELGAPHAFPLETKPVPPTPGTMSPPPLVPAWPETVYFLGAWLRAGSSVETVVAAYRTAFASDPSRLIRLAQEVHVLLDPARDPAERDGLIATHAPQWAGAGGTVVLSQVAYALGQPRAM